LVQVVGERIRITARALALYLLAASLIGAYIVEPSSREPLYLALALIGVAVSSHLYGKAVWRAVHLLRVTRVVPEAAVEGEEVRVRVVVENASLVPLIGVEIEDTPPELFRVVDRPVRVIILPPRGRVEFAYRVVPMIGSHEFGEVRVTVRDPLALTSSTVEFRGVEASVVDVAPKTRGVETLPRILTTIPYMGVSARKKGWGSTFFYLREYVEGDETRFIDWKAYARLQRLMVKEYEAEEALSVSIIVPVGSTMLYGPLGSTIFETALRLVAELSYFYLVRGDMVTLILMDGSGRVLHAKNLRGRGSSKLAWRLLAQVRPPRLGDARPSHEDVEEFLRRKAPIYMGSGGHFLVIVSDSKSVVEDLLRMRYPALLRKSVGGGVVYLDRRLFETPSLREGALERVKLQMKVIEEAATTRAALANLGYSFVVAGPDAELLPIVRRLEGVAARWR